MTDRPITILLVEDEPVSLSTLARILRREGYDVLTASSPDVALGVFKAHNGQVDVLLSDVVMPTVDGDQLARQLLAMAPSLHVLLMSGHSAELLADRLAATPGAVFLPKPFTPTMLTAQIRRLTAPG